nr:probable glutamate receptor isoform X1 [Procambarus clarkii]
MMSVTMVWVAGVVLAVGARLVQEGGAATPVLTPTRHLGAHTKFVVDYVQFYKPYAVCLLRHAEISPWVEKTFRGLVAHSNAYLAVMPIGHPMDARTHLSDGATHLPDEATHLGNLGGGSGIVSQGHTLFVFRLETADDARRFYQVFRGAPLWYSWLLLIPQTRWTQWLHHLYLPLSSKVIVATYTEGEKEERAMPWWQVYQVSPATEKNVLASGIWSLGTSVSGENDWVKGHLRPGESVEERQMTYGTVRAVKGDPLPRRTDLTGLHLSCTTIHTSPHTVLTEGNNGTVTVAGIFGGVLKLLQELTNFTCSCRPSRDGLWGSLVDGKWTGMIRDLVDGEAEMAVASLDITDERSTAVDFLLPITRTHYKMVMKRPSNSDRTWMTFTQEFHVHVWAVLAASVCLLSLTLYLTSAIVKERQHISLSDSLCTVFGALCGQGTNLQFQRLPCRLVVLTVLLLQIVVLAHYTSNLVSALAVGPSLPAISSIGDVVSNPTFSLGTLQDTAYLGYLKNSPEPEHQMAYTNLMAGGRRGLVASTTEGVARTLQENYIYMDCSVYLVNEIDCRHVILPTAYFPAITSIALQKGSPLVHIFNQIILKMKTSGLMHSLEQRWTTTEPDCEETHFMAIGLDALLTPFLLLMLVMGVSVVVCAAEHLLQEVCSRVSVQHTVIRPKHIKCTKTF